MMDVNGNRLLTEVHSSFLMHRAPTYAASVHEKCGALPNCVGVIDGTVIKIARPTGIGGKTCATTDTNVPMR